MEQSELLELKTQVLTACQAKIQAKLDQLDESMRQLQEDANQETKSTAGDKYETARAMAMLEKENLGRQHASFAQQYRILTGLTPALNNTPARIGSLVSTQNGLLFYLSVSIGELIIADRSCIVISPASPLGKSLVGKSVGEQFVFRNQPQEIAALV